jgi:hypothetical protein
MITFFMNTCLYTFGILFVAFWSITSPLAYIFIARKFDKKFKDMVTLQWLPMIPGTAWSVRTMIYCGLCIRKKNKNNRYFDKQIADFDFKSTCSFGEKLIAYIHVYTLIAAIAPLVVYMSLNLLFPHYFSLPK